jgi:hypothetical protein
MYFEFQSRINLAQHWCRNNIKELETFPILDCATFPRPLAQAQKKRDDSEASIDARASP